MKKTGFCLLVFWLLAAQAAAENLNAYMMDLVQRERGNLTNARKREIIHAFQSCTDTAVRNFFVQHDYFEENSNNGAGVYVTQDSLKWAFRVKRCYYADIDDDEQKEILFHEKDPRKGIQLAVVLKKNGAAWDVVFSEYGVFSNLLFEGRTLKSITVVEFHQYANPCDVFKKYTVTAVAGQTRISREMNIHVPFFYHYPVKFEMPQRTVTITADTLYFYDISLYNQTDYPYKKEMRNAFRTARRFNSAESAWMHLVPQAIYWAGFVESRGPFATLLLAFNAAYFTNCPDYLLIYVPNGQFKTG